MDYVQAGPCVPWVVREVDELEEDCLPSVKGVPVDLVPHVYLGREDEEDSAAEGGDHDQRLHPDCQLRVPPLVPRAEDERGRIEQVQQCVGQYHPVHDRELPVHPDLGVPHGVEVHAGYVVRGEVRDCHQQQAQDEDLEREPPPSEAFPSRPRAYPEALPRPDRCEHGPTRRAVRMNLLPSPLLTR